MDSEKKERERHKKKNRPENRDPETGKMKPPGDRPLSKFGRWLFNYVGRLKRAETYRPYVENARSSNDAAVTYGAEMRMTEKEIEKVRKDIIRLADEGLLILPWKLKG